MWKKFGFRQQKNQFLMTRSTWVGNTMRADLKLQEKCNMDTEFFFLQGDSSLVLAPIRIWSTVLCASLEHIPIYSTWKEPGQQAQSLLHGSNQSADNGQDWGVISEVPVWSLLYTLRYPKASPHHPPSEASPLHPVFAEVHNDTSPCLLLPRKNILHSWSSRGCTSTPIFDQNFCSF